MPEPPEPTVAQQMLKAEVFVLAIVLRALVETHPDKALLAKSFARLTQTNLANLLASEGSDAHLNLLEVYSDGWLKHMKS